MNKTEILKNLNFADFYKSLIPSLKTNGKPEALGLCPVHGDTHPSLSVNLETGLFHCFSCDFKGDVFTFYQRVKGVDFPTALKELGELAGITESNIKPAVVATFSYLDGSGQLLYVKERLEPGRNGRPKEFVFKHQEGNERALGRGCDAVLYNLPGLAKAKYCFIVEGEAKADLLHSWGLIATCLDSGAKSPWKDEYIKAFKGKEKVIILPDNDKPGREYAIGIARALHGKVKELKVVELPELQEKEDIIDWAKMPGNNKAKLIALVRGAPVWSPQKESGTSMTSLENSMVFTRLNDLFQEPEEQTKWLADGLLPTGGFSIVVAKPKVGKSTIARGLALNIASGQPFLGKEVSKGAVVYLALEEKRYEIKRHFQDMGATGNEEIHIYVGGAPADAITQIKRVVQEIKPVLVIIDPLFRFTKVKDGNDYHQVTNALEPLLRLARDTGTHVLCVHHSRKGESTAEDSFLGSQAIFGSVDTLMIMKRHEHYRTLQTIQRYGDDLPETILAYDKDTRNTSLGGSKQDEDFNILGNAIVDFLKGQEEPVTEKVVEGAIEGRTALKRKALRDFVEKGKIQKLGKGGKNDPYKYSCSLVPTICREQQNKNQKTTANPHGCKDYSCSQDFDVPDKEKEFREQAFLVENDSQKPVSDIPLEVEFAEEVRANV